VQKSPLCSITASSRASNQFLANGILLCSRPDCRALNHEKPSRMDCAYSAPMSLLWFGRLLQERVRDRLQIGVAKATREYTIQNPDSNPSEETDAGDQVVLQFAH
jgi:hypothetical protein